VKMATLTVRGRAVLGSFGKGVSGSVTLNFATSGGANCDTECAFHPESTNPAAADRRVRCYAHTCENRADRSQLLAKLERHESTDALVLIDAAQGEMAIRGYFAPWFRFSAFGSVPAAVPGNLREFLARLAAAGTPVHFPVETAGKAETYRAAVGDLVAVRESVTSSARWISAPGPVSAVAGCMDMKPRQRIDAARAMAKARTAATGRRVIICPAVAARHLGTASPNAKCGNCTACANRSVDILYPAHA
jgi:hypothetical protein